MQGVLSALGITFFIVNPDFQIGVLALTVIWLLVALIQKEEE